MLLDFIGFISTNVNLTAAQKLALLSDFCAQYGYQEQIDDGQGNIIPNPVTQKEFANHKITRYIIETVNAIRLSKGIDAVTIEELELEAS